MNPDRSAQKPATGAPAASDQRGSSVSPTPDGSEQAGPSTYDCKTWGGGPP